MIAGSDRCADVQPIAAAREHTAHDQQCGKQDQIEHNVLCLGRPKPGDAGFQRTDREAYLNEQLARQQRGEPIDVDWVRAELGRVRQEQQQKLAASRRRLWGLVIAMAVLFIAMLLARHR